MDNAPKPVGRSKALYDMVDIDDPEFNTKACAGPDSAHVDIRVTITTYTLPTPAPQNLLSVTMILQESLSGGASLS